MLFIPHNVDEAIFMHFPIAGTAGGLDLKLGEFMTSFGADMADPHYNIIGISSFPNTLGNG